MASPKQSEQGHQDRTENDQAQEPVLKEEGPMLPTNITIGEKYGPAMEITEQAAADAYFERCVEHTMRFGKTRHEAETIERVNLGYYAGYYGEETRRRVERLFQCAHPVFGSIERFGQPTAEDAFNLGARHGR